MSNIINIVIIGSPRSGKSIFARKLFERDKRYSIIGSDEVRQSFDKIFPELEINDRSGVGTKTKFPIFMNKLLECLSRNNIREIYYIFEGDFSYFEQAVNLFDKNKCILIFMGKAELTEEKLFQNVRKYAYEKDDRTKDRGDEELRGYCKNYLRMSKEYKEKCLKNNRFI